MTATWTLRYRDGAGNGYRIEGHPDHDPRLSYDPVRPAMSSSGIYDGGPAVTDLHLDKACARELWQLAEALVADASQHRAARAMGTGLLSWVRGGERRRVILEPAAGQTFEARLRALIDEDTDPASLR